MSDHLSSADEATPGFFEDGGATFGDALLDDEDDEDNGEVVEESVKPETERDGDGVSCESRRCPAVSGSQSAASSPIVPAAVPESPPATPTAQTPPESPPTASAGGVNLPAPDSPPSSPAGLVGEPMGSAVEPAALEPELLDFEADGVDVASSETPVKDQHHHQQQEEEESRTEQEEDGEVESRKQEQNGRKRSGDGSDGEDADSLEEGEVSDDDDKALLTEPKSVCRFFNKGQCTWGVSCRFIHPGVTDKGNYNMFAPTKSVSAASDSNQTKTSAGDKTATVESEQPQRKTTAVTATATAVTEPRAESAWDRAMREAKERVRKSSKRRQTDADFEDKKMNLGLGQPTDCETESDYYTRPASPVIKDSGHRSHRELDPYDPYAVHRRPPSPRASPPPGRYRVGYPPPPPAHFPGPLHGPHYGLPPSGPGRRVAPPHPMLSSGGGPAAAPTEVWGMSGPRGRIAPPHPGHHGEFEDSYRGARRRGSPLPPSDPRRDWKQERYDEVARLRRGSPSDGYVDPWMRARSPRGSRRSYSSGSSRRSRSSRSVSRSSSSSSFSSDSASDRSGPRRRRRHTSSSSRRRRSPSPRHRRRVSRSPPTSQPVIQPRRTAASAGSAGRPRYASHTMGAMLDSGRKRSIADKPPPSSSTAGPASSSPATTTAAETPASVPPSSASSATSRKPVDPAVRRLAAATAALQRASEEGAAARRAGAVPSSHQGAPGVVSEASRRSAASVAALATRALHESARRSLAAAKSAAAAAATGKNTGRVAGGAGAGRQGGVTAAGGRQTGSTASAGRQIGGTAPASRQAGSTARQPAPAVVVAADGERRRRRSGSTSSSSSSSSSGSSSSRQGHSRQRRSLSTSVSSVSSRSVSPRRSRSRSWSRRTVRQRTSPDVKREDAPVSARHPATLGASSRDRAGPRQGVADVGVRRPQHKTAAPPHGYQPSAHDRKPIDVLAESGKKQQIRLTLRGSAGVQTSRRVIDQLGLHDQDDEADTESRGQQGAGSRKRPLTKSASSSADDLQAPASKIAAVADAAQSPVKATVVSKSAGAKKSSTSRREELMKQLRAVEEAISKKRTN